jgi:hypothetical protein
MWTDLEFGDQAKAAGDSELSEGTALLAESFRQQGHEWIAEAARWREVESQYLSDRAVRAWMLEALKVTRMALEDDDDRA